MIVVNYKTRNSVGKVEVKESVVHSTIALLEKRGAEITNVRKSVQEGLVHISCASDLVIQKIYLKQFTNPESMFYITVVSANTPYEFLEKYNPDYDNEDLHFFEECLLLHLKNESEEMSFHTADARHGAQPAADDGAGGGGAGLHLGGGYRGFFRESNGPCLSAP